MEKISSVIVISNYRNKYFMDKAVGIKQISGSDFSHIGYSTEPKNFLEKALAGKLRFAFIRVKVLLW